MMRRIKRSCMILLVLFCVGCSGENTGQTLEKPAEESVSATAARETEATQTIEMPDDGESAVPEEIRDVLEKNPSVVGWITIEDTNIDYPIAWNPGDNEYFLYRDIDGNESESVPSI
ncbi:MAG: hypothetical protein ACLTKI_06660 [Lachnospiraceae bacterium]